jgi:hypothetical protein
MREVRYDEEPEDYVCVNCGIRGVKLWRPYQTSDVVLTCMDCTEKKEGKPCRLPGTDQIGWSIPAVPTPDGETYWGYTSVPDAGCRWWDKLPLHQVIPARES